MMKKKLILVSLVLAGCAHQPQYVPPKDGHLAKISFVNLSPGTPITVVFYEDGISCKGIQRLSFLSSDYKGSSVEVSAGKPFTFTIDHSVGSRYCRQTYMFTPAEFQYRVTTVARTEQCVLVVEKLELSEGSQNWKAVNGLIKREYRTPFFQDGEWCEPLKGPKS